MNEACGIKENIKLHSFYPNSPPSKREGSNISKMAAKVLLERGGGGKDDLTFWKKTQNCSKLVGLKHFKIIRKGFDSL